MRNYFRGILLLGCMLFLQQLTLDAQQLPLFNQNVTSLNPASISSGYFKYNAPTTAAIRYRYQWTKVKDAPKTLLANFQHFNEERRISFGGDFISDKTGPTGFIGISGRVGYALPLSKDLLLSFGLSGGTTQYRVRGDELNFLEQGDLASNNVTKIYPDFSFGTMLYWKENYFIGFSLPQVFSLNLAFKDENNEYNFQRVRHYYGIVGARFDMGSDSWLEGSVETRYVQNVPFYVNAKVGYEFRQIFFINASGSSAKEVSLGVGAIANIGYNSNLIRFGYNFSNFYQNYGPNFGMVHELGMQIYL